MRWQVAIVILTGAVRVAAAAWSTPVVMPDSERYRNDAMPLAPFAVWDGYGPGVLTQVIHLLPLQIAVVIQTTLVVTLWGGAAVYAASVARTSLSWPTFLALHAWSLSPWFFIWDAWVLTESLTLAGCALAAVGVAATRSGARAGHWVAVVGLAVAVTARPFVGAILLPLVVPALFWPMRLARLRALAAPTVAALLLACFATWQVLSFSATTNSPFSYLPEPESLEQVQATDRFAGRGHLVGYLDLARDAGMPSCAEAETLAVAELSDIEKLDRLRAIADCADFDRWLADGGLPWTRELTGNTVATAAELFRPSYWLESTFAGYMTPDDRTRHLREFTRTRWANTVVTVNALMFGTTALVSLAAMFLSRRRIFFLVALTAVSAVSLYAWSVDGIEYWRHVLPAFAILVPLAVTLLVATGYEDTSHSSDVRPPRHGLDL